MSRLDEIKARADAATQGPWSFDWSEGEVPVFYGQTTKISGTFSVEANTIEDAEFVEAAREDVPWLVERVRELIGAICWDTTCLNCASLLDSNYDQYVRAEIAEAEVERLTAERDALAQIKRHIDEVRNGTGWTVQIYGVLLQQCDQYGKTIDTRRADKAEAERDALAAQVAEAVHLAEVWASDLATDAMVHVMDGVVLEAINEQMKRLLDLRDALADSEADTTDTQPTDQEDQA